MFGYFHPRALHIYHCRHSCSWQRSILLQKGNCTKPGATLQPITHDGLKQSTLKCLDNMLRKVSLRRAEAPSLGVCDAGGIAGGQWRL
jgi:hypothetical protein